MPSFHTITMNEEEELLFGPVSREKRGSLGFGAGSPTTQQDQKGARVVGVSNQRVIVEAGDSCITIPNGDIKAVVIKRTTTTQGDLDYVLIRVERESTQDIRLDIPGLGSNPVPKLREIFPNAAVREQLGFFATLRRLLRRRK